MKVLVAEDETIIRLDLCALLARHGFTVCAEARDGAEAVLLARTAQPEAAILDLRMPNLDGIEAARRIYAERPIPIVMLTAFSDRAYVEKAIEAGVFAYLVKPFRESDVVPALRAAATRHDELLAARRSLGAEPSTRIRIHLPSQSGFTWPLGLRRREDGSVEVRLEQ